MTYKIWVKHAGVQPIKVVFERGDVDEFKKVIKNELQIKANTDYLTLRRHGEKVDLDPELEVDKSFVNNSKTPIQVIVEVPDTCPSLSGGLSSVLDVNSGKGLHSLFEGHLNGALDDLGNVKDDKQLHSLIGGYHTNGDLVAVKNANEVLKDDWKWSCFEEVHDVLGMQSRKPIKSSNHKQSDDTPFKIVYLCSEDVRTTFVELSSQPLIKILQEIFPKNTDILDEPPKVKAQELYHAMKTIEDIRDDLAEAAKDHDLMIEKIHMHHLVRFLKHEYSQTGKIRKRMLANKVVSFNMLWVFFTTNLDVWFRCKMSGQQIGGIISSTREEVEFRNFREKVLVFIIDIKVVEYDGHGFKHCTVTRKIEYFKGERSFSDLPVVPFKSSKSHDFLKNTIADNGKRFFELAKGRNFMNYEGPLFRWKFNMMGCMEVEKMRANGRVMIDFQSFATMKPNYPMENARPPNKCDIELFGEEVYLKDEIHQEANYHLAPALVYGFSFALKEWGQFLVLNFSEIKFDTESFDHLVMPQDRKDILEGLVRQYEQTDSDESANNTKSVSIAKSLDPISNKGKGCIFLCYGPPGTGKTLTAESVAEYLKRPLWMLSVHELGMRPAELEQQLAKILDIAFTWNAVLLLDEADVYLEKRGKSDLNRNAMTCIFLRQLEYYQGILFLTTNRVMTFDDAFCSRINMFFHYPKLNLEERNKVWTNFIDRANLLLKADDFAEHDLNGREIRNIIHTAQMLARSKGEDVTADQVNKVIKVIQEFQDDMKKSGDNDKNEEEPIINNFPQIDNIQMNDLSFHLI